MPVPTVFIDIFAAIAISVGSRLAERLIVAVLARKARYDQEKIDELAHKAKDLAEKVKSPP